MASHPLLISALCWCAKMGEKWGRRHAKGAAKWLAGMLERAEREGKVGGWWLAFEIPSRSYLRHTSTPLALAISVLRLHFVGDNFTLRARIFIIYELFWLSSFLLSILSPWWWLHTIQLFLMLIISVLHFIPSVITFIFTLLSSMLRWCLKRGKNGRKMGQGHTGRERSQ
jgi:hypothetical protein